MKSLDLVLTSPDYWIKDVNLYQKGISQIKIAERDMPGIKNLLKMYRGFKPLKDARITGCITVTKETAVLINTLVELGAEVRWCSDNRHAINDEVSAALVYEGIPVFGRRDESLKEYYWCMEQALDFKNQNGDFIGPTQIIDDGCDITRYVLDNKPEILPIIKGITEQTTCGIQEIKKIHKKNRLNTALININDSFIKKYFDNYYGIKESLIVGLHNALSVQISGKNVVVYGYGPVGKGCIDAVKGIGGKVYIVEADILKAVQAHMDGVHVVSREEALEIGDIFITATGCIDVINEADIHKMKDNAVLCNIGHGDEEYDIKALLNKPDTKSEYLNEHTTMCKLSNGKKIYSLCKGALLNMIASSGNPPFIMNLTFVSHIIAQIDLHQNQLKYQNACVYEFPTECSSMVAKLSFPEIYNKLYQWNNVQRKYIGVD